MAEGKEVQSKDLVTMAEELIKTIAVKIASQSRLINELLARDKVKASDIAALGAEIDKLLMTVEDLKKGGNGEPIGPAGKIASYKGYGMVKHVVTKEKALLNLDEASMQAGWQSYSRIAYAPETEFNDLLMNDVIVSPYKKYFSDEGLIDEGIWVRIDGEALTYWVEVDEFDKSHMTAILLPINESHDSIDQWTEVDINVGDKWRRVGIEAIYPDEDADEGSVDLINDGNNDYPNGFFVESDNLVLQVDFDEAISDVRLSVLVHEPSDRAQKIFFEHEKFIKGDTVAEHLQWYFLEYDLRNPIGLALIEFEGNTENNWNGIYEVVVETKDAQKEKPTITIPDQVVGQFKMGDPDNVGAELMKDVAFQEQFRYNTDVHTGRRESFSTQEQYDKLASNPDIAIAKYTGSKPLALIDNIKRSHILVIETDVLQTVRTDGNLIIKAKKVVRPLTANVIAIGQNVLLDLGKTNGEEQVVSWALLTWMNKRGEVIKNCVAQGGRLSQR